jgi:transposase
MVRRQFRDEQRTKRRGRDDRYVIEAVLWWRRTGVTRRDLPEEFGSWKTVFHRFDRGSKDGRWSRLFEALRVDRDDEWHFHRVHVQPAETGAALRNALRGDASE